MDDPTGADAALPDTPDTPALDADTLATIDRWIAYQVWKSRVPGAQVAIGLGGRLLLSTGYGLADVERRAPMTPNHLFHIASHSKTFTATVVLRLVEQRRLGIEDRIGTHLPDLAEHPIAEVSVRELLEHTGGLLRDGADADFWQGGHDFPDADELRRLLGPAGKRPPGERFGYSNLGFGLLGAIIETVTGGSYADAVTEHVVGPLGLTDTASRFLTDREGDYATGYTGLHAATTREPLPHVDTRALDPATGFTSTGVDLVSYFTAHALGDDRLLTDHSKRRMQHAASRTNPAKPDGPTYGLGLDGDTVNDRRIVGHGGGYPGHSTKTLLDPADALVVTALTNAIDGPASTLATGIVTIIDDARAHPVGEPWPAALLARTGRWRSAWGVTDLAVVGGRLLALHPGDADPIDTADELTTDDPDRLIITAGNGFGSVGEPVTFPDEDTMRYGGMSLHRFASLPDHDH